MAIWKKLDDLTTVADQPYSAFLTKRLTTNVNAYSTDLSRNTAAVWPFETPVRWASYGQPTGTVVMIDCGLNALELQFRLSCFTDTDTGGGTIYIKHIESGARTSQYLPPTPNDKNVVDIAFVFTSPVRGLQSFFVGWISDDDETLGTVAIKGGVANQVYIGNGGTWTFPVGTGLSAEMHARLHFSDTPNVGELAPIGDARLDYQVCLFSHRSGNNPHGVFTIWPELEQTPAFLPTFYDGNLQMVGTLIGLGVLNLYAIAATVTRQAAGTLAAPTAFSQTTPPTALANNIGAALTTCRPVLANNVSSAGMLGCVLPAGETLSFAFAVQNKGEYGLFVVFKTFGYNISQTTDCQFTLMVFEAFTDTKILEITLENLAVPRLQPQTTQSATNAAAFAVNGIVASEGKWGLRDSMPMTQPNVGTTVRFLTDAVTLGDIAGDGVAYYATITATTDVYIYSFSARLV